MKIFLCTLCLLFLSLSLPAQTIVCACKPGKETKKNRQQRSVSKHEIHYDQFSVHDDTIDVHYIYKWQRKYNSITSGIPVNPKSKRVTGTPEDSLYTLKAYMWFVKTEENDCDFHIEIGPKGKGGTRIVVEVTKENTVLKDKIRHQLETLGLKIKGCSGGSVDTHFPHGIPVAVTGLGFYDASHKPDTNHGDKHTKKYSWELHPVQDIEFL